MDRVEIVHQNFIRRVQSGDLPAGRAPEGPLHPDTARALFLAQLQCRALDRQARKMQAAGHGYYTIGSSGHEGMAAVAEALRPNDMAFLHYRDGAFQIARAHQVEGQRPLHDMLLSFACAADDPISGGRHKVLGSAELMIPPQTSTIASHLPKAVGAAYAIGTAKRHRPEHARLRNDGIVMASFGDASANHATAQAAFNTAAWSAYQSAPMPILFVCEDNGIGISTPTPSGWIAANFQNRPALKYFSGDGCDLFDAYRAAREAADFVRTHRRPAVLHLKTVRLYGHAGADVATSYLPKSQVEAEEANDPLLHSVRLLEASGAMTRAEALDAYLDTEAEVAALAEEIVQRPRLQTADEVMASIVPPPRNCSRPNAPSPQERAALFGSDARAMEEPQPMSRLIGWALSDLMLEHGEVVMMGEDVGRKGGVYGVTQKLQSRFGPDRVIDTLLDETSILGLAIGMAHNGFVPIPEIQFLAYLHNAEDQIRGEAATLPFFSNGQFTNPMVLRIAGLGYQKGFGGHFHNDNALSVLRDIPGLILACPSDGAEAVLMLREAVRLAREEQRIVAFVEPIALYSARDFLESGDGGWMRHYPAPSERARYGEVAQRGDGQDVAIVSFGNGTYLAAQAADRLRGEGIAARVVDLRWLAPLPLDSMLNAIKGCGATLVVDETRRSGGVSEGVITALVENGVRNIARYAADDSFIATGPAYAATLPSVDGICRAVRDLMGPAKR